MANTKNYLPKTGVGMGHWAKVLTDTAGDPDGLTYSEVKKLPGMVQIAFAPNAQTGTYWADNIAYATAAQLGDMTLGIQCPDLPPEDRAEWYGQKYENGLLEEGAINPIEMAFGYRIRKANGAFRYLRVYKVKPAVADETTGTGTNAINWQDGTIPAAIAMSQALNTYRRMIDDDPNLPVGVTPDVIAAGWFTSPLWVVSATIPET